MFRSLGRLFGVGDALELRIGCGVEVGVLAVPVVVKIAVIAGGGTIFIPAF